MRKEPCVRCRRQGRDKTGDNFTNYGEGKGGFCHACGYTIPSDDWLAANGKTVEKEWECPEEMAIFTEEDHNKLKEITTLKGNGFRGISDETYKYFGVRHEYDETTGELVAQYYPVTKENKFSGYKKRLLPKKFTSFGEVGKDCDLFNAFRFHGTASKTIVLTAGEVDALSLYQILRDYSKSKGNEAYAQVAVVSPTTGESSSTQLQKQYSFLNQFEKIVICFDMDKAGQEAIEKAAKVLPRNKLFVMKLPMKDINEMLMVGREREVISAFFQAHQYTASGVVGSDQLINMFKENAAKPRLSLPPFLKTLSDMLVGGFVHGIIVNISAGTGVGKSVYVNELVRHWILKDTEHTVGVVSFELDCQQYSQTLLSRHLERNLARMTDQDKISYLDTIDVEAKAKELFLKEDGTSRFFVSDNRGINFEELKALAEAMIVSQGVSVLVFDPISDLTSSMQISEQELLWKWQKEINLTYGTIIINIHHVKKASGNGKQDAGGGGFIQETDTLGAGGAIRSASVNIVLMRDKSAEDEIERNTTSILLWKNRQSGNTGPAGELYYDPETHVLWDKADWLKKQHKEF